MKVILEGHSEFESDSYYVPDISCIRRLLDDVCAVHAHDFAAVFEIEEGPESFKLVLDRWEKNGILGREVAAWVEKLRKVAFETDDLGEASVEIRNPLELPDIAPGNVPVLCAVLDYLSSAAGIDGLVKLVPHTGQL